MECLGLHLSVEKQRYQVYKLIIHLSEAPSEDRTEKLRRFLEDGLALSEQFADLKGLPSLCTALSTGGSEMSEHGTRDGDGI